MLDEGMLYWYARLSAHYPTVEIRMGDVMPTLDDALLLAALARALVATLLRDVRDGVPAPNVPHPLLMAAHWRAAHDGLEGVNIDMATREPRPAVAADAAAVRLRTPGTGAARRPGDGDRPDGPAAGEGHRRRPPASDTGPAGLGGRRRGLAGATPPAARTTERTTREAGRHRR